MNANWKHLDKKWDESRIAIKNKLGKLLQEHDSPNSTFMRAVACEYGSRESRKEAMAHVFGSRGLPQEVTSIILGNIGAIKHPEEWKAIEGKSPTNEAMTSDSKWSIELTNLSALEKKITEQPDETLSAIASVPPPPRSSPFSDTACRITKPLLHSSDEDKLLALRYAWGGQRVAEVSSSLKNFEKKFKKAKNDMKEEHHRELSRAVRSELAFILPQNFREKYIKAVQDTSYLGHLEARKSLLEFLDNELALV
jgi:hypothetical protein